MEQPTTNYSSDSRLDRALPRSSKNATGMLDVLVIGAGLSGLQAALSCQKAGLTTAIVEARDRVGGKVWSVPLASDRGCADLGAAWVNINTQPKVAAYIKQFGLKLVTQRLEGKAVMQIDGKERIEFPFGIMPDVSNGDELMLRSSFIDVLF
jgi:monoamine oxidase